MAKTEQLQLRVSAEQKEKIKRQATLAGDDVSTWVLRKLLPSEADEFQHLVNNFKSGASTPSHELADIHDFLESLSGQTLASAVRSADLKSFGRI